jgi:hypothetical protein
MNFWTHMGSGKGVGPQSQSVVASYISVSTDALLTIPVRGFWRSASDSGGVCAYLDC